MTEQFKYIVLSDGTKEYAVIFDAKLSHVDVARGIARESAYSDWSKILLPLQPVSAGFIHMPECTVGTGGSESLRLKPRPQDQALFWGEASSLPPKPTAPPRSLLERAKSARAR